MANVVSASIAASAAVGLVRGSLGDSLGSMTSMGLDLVSSPEPGSIG